MSERIAHPSQTHCESGEEKDDEDKKDYRHKEENQRYIGVILGAAVKGVPALAVADGLSVVRGIGVGDSEYP